MGSNDDEAPGLDNVFEEAGLKTGLANDIDVFDAIETGSYEVEANTSRHAGEARVNDVTHVEMERNTNTVDETNCDQELNQRSDHAKIETLGRENQKNVMNAQTDTVNSQTNAVSGQIGAGSGQTGVMNGQTGALHCQISAWNSQKGREKGQTDAVNRQSDAVIDQPGISQIGVANSQTGVANSETGVVKNVTNIVSDQRDVMNTQTFVVNDHTDGLNSKTGTASVRAGIVNVQTGVMDGQMKDQGKDTCKNESSGFLHRISRFLRRKRKHVKNKKDEGFDPSQSTDESITEC